MKKNAISASFVGRIIFGYRTALLPILLLLIAAPVAKGDRIYTNNQRYESINDIAARYGMQVMRNGTEAVLYNQRQRVELQANKRELKINNVKSVLSFPVFRGKSFYISQFDMLTFFDPVFRSNVLVRQNCRVIVIDPGHGGKDQGARGRRFSEKQLTLILAKKLKALLERLGYKVALTRNYDTYVPLQQRAAIARKNRADILVALHLNAVSDKSISGIESYALTPDGAPSSSSDRVSMTKFSGNFYDRNNMALAFVLHRNMLMRTKAVDRGVKKARFVVLREVDCPAVLVEAGFISNPAEERRLASDAYLNQLARGIADGIIQYDRAARNGVDKFK